MQVAVAVKVLLAISREIIIREAVSRTVEVKMSRKRNKSIGLKAQHSDAALVPRFVGN